MTTNDEPTEIVETLETIRAEKYPSIPPELVKELVQLEYEGLEDRDQVQGDISEVVEEYLEEE
jgi:hypothetical protein